MHKAYHKALNGHEFHRFGGIDLRGVKGYKTSWDEFLMSVEGGLLESKDFEEEDFKRLDQDRWRCGFELLDRGVWLATYSLLGLVRLLLRPWSLHRP